MPPEGTRDSQQASLEEPLLNNEIDVSTPPVSSTPSSGEVPQEDVVVAANGERKISRNVPLVLMYAAFAFAGRSIWNQSVLATFVFLLRNNDASAVGYITGVMGLMQLATSFPTGYLADIYRRDTLLKFASVVGVFAIFMTLFACWEEQYIYLVLALASWGCFWGVANTSLSALFADSIPAGQRSLYFTRRTVLVTIGNTAGPLVALSMFALLGDKWTVRDCAIVMAVGQLFCFPAIVLLCFMSDDHAIADDDENIASISSVAAASRQSRQAASMKKSDSTLTIPSMDGDNNTQEASSPGDGEGPQDALLVIESGTAEEEELVEEEARPKFCFGWIPEHRLVPLAVAAADLTTGAGSGMSIRFFPIFFVQNLHLGPVLVQVLSFVTPLMQSVLKQVKQRLAKRYGRCHVTVGSKWIGISFMFLMVTCYWCGLPRWVVCTIYVFRSTFMNSTGALTRSVLMDNVPKQERAKWSALESVNMFGWSGSAALGGAIVQFVGIVPLFCVTACIQVISTLFLVSIFSYDHVEQDLPPASNPSESVQQEAEESTTEQSPRTAST